MESKNEPPVHEFKVLHKGQRALHHFVTLNFGKSHFGMDLSSHDHFGTVVIPSDGFINFLA